MPAVSLLKPAGLHTSDNEISAIPDGALVKARNCVIRARNVIEPRRGFDLSPASMFMLARAMFPFGSDLVSWSEDGALFSVEDSGQTITELGLDTYLVEPTTSLRPKGVEAAENLYLTTHRGIRVLDSLTGFNGLGNPGHAGVPRALDPTGTATVIGTGAWMQNNSRVAYRVVWGYKDAHNKILLGAPSGRTLVTNASGGTCYVGLSIPIPDQITTSHFVRVYRTFTSESSSDSPDDECFLVYEANPNGIQIAGRSMQVYDYAPEIMLNDPLYTNPRTGYTELAAKEQPPVAHDVAWWQNRLWFGNTTGRHRFFLDLIGCGLPAGLQAGDTISIRAVDQHGTIRANTFTARATPTLPNEFRVYTASPSPGINVEQTAKSLVDAINTATLGGSADIYAYYMSPDSEVPGKIILEHRLLGVDAFGVWASRPTAWHPALPTSAVLARESDANRLPNGLAYSERYEPEAVPLVNNFQIGSKSKAILRIVPLRERLFVFKEDGIFVVSGEDAFRVDPLDTTVRLIAPDSVVAVANRIYALTDQGVVAVTDGGVQVISRAIEQEILALASPSNLANLRIATHAVSYESDRSYILFLPTSGMVAEQAYVYNVATNAWTRWDGLTTLSGVVHPEEDRLYLAATFDSFVTAGTAIERKSLSNADYGENSRTLTCVAVSSVAPFLTLASAAGVQVGSYVHQGGRGAWVTSVDTIFNRVYLTSVDGFAVGALTVESPIHGEVQFAALTAGFPAELKHFSAATFHFRRSRFALAEAVFSSDLATAESFPDLRFQVLTHSSGWGSREIPRNKRVLVPKEHQRCNYLTVGFRCSEARSMWALNGVTVEVDRTSERNSR